MDRRAQIALELLTGSSTLARSLPSIAAHVNLSTSRLRHLVKTEVGVSPGQFAKFVKLQRARRLLEDTFLTVKEITYSSGFNDTSHFVRDFRKTFGMTPTEWRRSSSHTINIQPAANPANR